MKKALRKPERIAIAWHPQLEKARTESQKVLRALKDAGIFQAESFSLYDETFRQRVIEKQFDVVIALGGDGTMLRAGKLCALNAVPVMGINMGSFGFLIEIQQTDWPQYIQPLIEGKWMIEERMMMTVELIRSGSVINTWEALNDVVIARGAVMRPIHIHVRINQADLTTYVSDGLVVSTATGSTAYSMAVGGPVLQPELRNMVIIPIAPHLCLDRGLVLQEDEKVEVSILKKYNAELSPDGGEGTEVLENDKIIIHSSSNSASFLRFQDIGFFYKNFIQYMQRNPSANKD